MEWISVEDRLPEYGELVKTDRGEEMRYYCNRFIGMEDKKPYPSRWMPLPSPPEEEQ
jgi:hypothetical protein